MKAWNQQSLLIVGAGSIGRRHARVLHALGLPDIRVSDPSSAQRDIVKSEIPVSAEFSNLDAALTTQPDAVFICTPPSLHIEQSIRALRAGAHVFCEKPLADSVASTAPLPDVIQESGKVFAVGFCMRHHEGLILAKQYVEAGRIGRLVSIRCRMGEHLPTVRPDYRTMFTLKESGAFDLAHEIDLACWYSGQPVTTVKGLCGAYSDLGFTAPDIAEILVRFGADCLAGIHLDFFGAARMRSTELIGTAGVITVEYASWDEATVSLYDLDRKLWQHEHLKTQRDAMFASEDREFLLAAATGSNVSCDFTEALKSLTIIEEVQRNP